MKSYLDLVPILSKVHRRQSRMSVFCIALSVFLVTAIFGMADMFIRSQILQSKQEHGDWHIAVSHIDSADAALIAARPDIEVISPYNVLNYRGEQGLTLEGNDVAICGSNEEFLTKIYCGMILEGRFPQSAQEAIVTENAGQMLGLSIGDSVAVKAPDETEWQFVVSGFMKNTSNILHMDSYGMFLSTEGYRALCQAVTGNEPADDNTMYVVRFAKTGNIQKKIADIKEQCGLTEEQVSENGNLLGLLGQSMNSFMMQIYTAAGILFVLVLLAGVLMIAGSLNSNVAQRTEFFGLMRCIGATPGQVMRFVTREALGWCRAAIPAGVVSGAVVVWVLCAVLRCLSPEYFREMPVFGISAPGISAGIATGLLTVLIAARSPARKAGRVSPLAAISGHANELQPVRKAARTRYVRIETALGIHHAKAGRKNLILMTGSFALSIILFLSFSVTVELMHHALTPLRPWTADLSIISPDNSCSVDRALLDSLKENPAVKRAYGRMFAFDVPVKVNGIERKVDLISYEQSQLAWAGDYLLEGDTDTVLSERNTGLTVYEPQNEIRTGDVAEIDAGGQSEKIRITGMLSECPFDSAAGVGTVICSEDTFRQITGQSDYTVIDIQLAGSATDDDVYAIHQMTPSRYVFADERMGNRSVRGTYYCFWLFVCGFLVLIALIAIFNVINSIAMSAAARTKQYGIFRAVGLSQRQLSKMLLSEACTYAVSGSIVGIAVGLACNKLLFDMLITFRWGEPWMIPYRELGTILLVMYISVAAAVYAPAKRLREMSIVKTISAQ